MTISSRLLRRPVEADRTPPPEILYSLAQTPPVPLLIGVGFQHAVVALMYAAYAVIAARGAGLEDVAAVGFVSLTLVSMGLVTMVQGSRTGFGAGRLLAQIPTEGAGSQRADRVDIERRVHVEFRGARLSSVGGLLVMRELDDALGLSDLAAAALRDTRRGVFHDRHRSTFFEFVPFVEKGSFNAS